MGSLTNIDISKQLCQLLLKQNKTSYITYNMQEPDFMSTADIAKQHYNINLDDMYSIIEKNNVFEYKKDSHIFYISEKYNGLGYGYTEKRTVYKDGLIHTVLDVYWSLKGRLFLYDLLQKENIRPIWEN